MQPGCMAHVIRDDHVEVLDVVGGRLELLTPPAATGDPPAAENAEIGLVLPVGDET